MLVQQDVVRFQIAMDVVHFVHSLDSENRLRNVKTTFIFSKHILAHKQRHQVATWKKVHHEVQILLILKGKLQVDDPRILGLDKDFTLCLHVRDLVLVNHLLLLHLFHCYDFTGLLVPANTHFTESASSNDRQWFEVPHRDLLAPINI